jgi:hypothetical protein
MFLDVAGILDEPDLTEDEHAAVMHVHLARTLGAQRAAGLRRPDPAVLGRAAAKSERITAVILAAVTASDSGLLVTLVDIHA